MTYQSNRSTALTDDEWNEMVALKDAINYNPWQVAPEKMELFTEYLVRSLEGKSDVPPEQVSQ